MKRSLLWILITVIVLTAFTKLIAIRQECMSACTASFQGAYPEIACKYECGILNKFKKPVKRP